VDKESTEGDALGAAFQVIIDRIEAQKDRLVVSINLAALAEPGAAHPPIPATFEIPFQRCQNGCAKPIIIAADNAPQQDPDLIALVADARRWASELLEGSTFRVRRPIDEVVLKACVTDTNDTPAPSNTSTIFAKSDSARVSLSTL
jgi:site-specific DNA recombinase